MFKNERFETKHDGRFIVDKLTDQVVVDNRTKNDLRVDWLNPLIAVRRGLEDTSATPETVIWIKKQNELMAQKNPVIKQVLEWGENARERGLTPAEIFLEALNELERSKRK